MQILFVANIKQLRQVFGDRDATLSGFAVSLKVARLPRVAKAQPWAEIGGRLQRQRQLASVPTQ